MTIEKINDYVKEKRPVYPVKLIDDRGKEYMWAGIGLQDYFAGQYMAAGKLPDEAFRLAKLAMKEREDAKQ